NVDTLHLRYGIPKEKLSELHGNSFMEVCPSCGAEYLQDFEVETIGMKKTLHRCSNHLCEVRLKDTVLDWENALPAKEMIPAEMHYTRSDLVLCLGTRFLSQGGEMKGGETKIVILDKEPFQIKRYLQPVSVRLKRYIIISNKMSKSIVTQEDT
ncbi:hypothetical protein GIB67_003135, partial [Kingdonia uniflora]